MEVRIRFDLGIALLILGAIGMTVAFVGVWGLANTPNPECPSPDRGSCWLLWGQRITTVGTNYLCFSLFLFLIVSVIGAALHAKEGLRRNVPP